MLGTVYAASMASAQLEQHAVCLRGDHEAVAACSTRAIETKNGTYRMRRESTT